MKRIYSILILFLISSLTAVAEEDKDTMCVDSVVVNRSRIYYPINKVGIYENYMSNKEELLRIKKHLATSPRIDSITIYSYASPEGRYGFNKWLAVERGKTAKKYLLANIPKYRHWADFIIKISPTSENWEGLREEVLDSYKRSDRDKVLEILDKPGLSDDQRKRRLRSLNGGRSWQYILKTIMPKLRYATWVEVWQPVEKSIPVKVIPGVLASKVEIERPTIKLPTRPIFIPELLIADTKEEIDTKTIVVLKSNVLYDVLSLVNYSIEVPFCGDKFSALYYHQFPWWRWGENNNKYCVRFLSIGAEGRWWFKPEPRPETEKFKKRDRLVGHFVGVYCESGKYDIERRKDVCYQGEFWSAGLSYGYSMPITRWLNLELSISAGYASIAHRGYTPSPDYSVLWRDYDKVGRWHYFGITKAQVSLVLPFRINVKKGGGL